MKSPPPSVQLKHATLFMNGLIFGISELYMLMNLDEDEGRRNGGKCQNKGKGGKKKLFDAKRSTTTDHRVSLQLPAGF